MPNQLKLDVFREAAESKDLPMIPAVAANILKMMKHGAPNTEALVDVFRYEPVIVTRLLKLANSPLYGKPGAITTVDHAASYLGQDTVMQCVLALALADAINQHYPAVIDQDYFWKRSIIAATASRLMLNDNESAHRESVFMSALLQDIGILVFAQVFGDQYLPLIEKLQYNHCALSTIEKQKFAMSHNEMGAWLLNEWNMPQTIIDGVYYSHNIAIPSSRVNACIALSGWIAEYCLCHQSGQPRAEIESKISEALQKFSPHDVDNVIVNVFDAFPDVASWFDSHSMMKVSPQLRHDLVEQWRTLTS